MTTRRPAPITTEETGTEGDTGTEVAASTTAGVVLLTEEEDNVTLTSSC